MDGDFAITEQQNLLIPLPDGTQLAANLILPDAAGSVPAIVVYQPYLKDLHGRGTILEWQEHFARRGYACLTVDIRGTGASDGIMAPPFSPAEREDATAMLGWTAAQPWCDGTTGMWGISYSGSTALAAASLRPGSLKAIIPMHGTANEFWGFLRPHGCRPGWWTEASWGPMMVLLSLLPPLSRDPERRWARVWRDRLDGLRPLPFVWHTTPFDQYMSWRTDASSVEAALYAVSGWHDYYPQATLDYFNAARGPRRVLISGWKHEFPDIAVRGAIDHRSEMNRCGIAGYAVSRTVSTANLRSASSIRARRCGGTRMLGHRRGARCAPSMLMGTAGWQPLLPSRAGRSSSGSTPRWVCISYPGTRRVR